MTLSEPETYQNLKNNILRLASNCDYDLDVLKTYFFREIESNRTLKAISSLPELITALEDRDSLNEDDVHLLTDLGSILNHPSIVELVTSYEKLYKKKSGQSCNCVAIPRPNLEEIVPTRQESTVPKVAHYVPQPISESNPLEINIVSRSKWGARDPRRIVKLSVPVRHIIVAHTATANGARPIPAIRDIQSYHMSKEQDWSDIGYSFIIGNDGRVYEGTGWLRCGIHTRGFNDCSYCIAFLGNFMDVTPKQEMVHAAKQLLGYGVRQGFIRNDFEIHGARDVTSTLSPGDQLYEIIKTWPHYKEIPSS